MSTKTLFSPALQADWIEILSALFNTCKVSSTAAAILLNAWDLLPAVDGENELFSAWVLKQWPDILDVDLESLTDAEGSQYCIELIQALLNTSKISREVAIILNSICESTSKDGSYIAWFNKMWPAKNNNNEDEDNKAL